MMCVLRWFVGLWIAALTVVTMTISTPVHAQERPTTELVSVDRDAGTARVRVRLGGRVTDINRIVTRLAPESGFRVDMEVIAELNEGRTITVCYDQLPGERPYMSRAPEAWNACQHFPRSRWLVAGATYLVPIRSEGAIPASERRERELERRVVAAERELAEANGVIMASVVNEESLLARIEVLEERPAAVTVVTPASSDSRAWPIAFGYLLAVGIAFIMFYLLHRQWRTRVMAQVRRLNRAWSLYGLRLRKKLSRVEHEIGMLKRGITETSGELAQSRTRQGQLRTRVHTLIVQLRENRNLLIAASQLIQEFQRRRQEDDDRRTNQLLNREHAIIVREDKVSAAEAQINLARIDLDEELSRLGHANLVPDEQKREFQAHVRAWNQEHEVTKTLQLWSGGLAKAEAASQLTDVERRMTELEATVRGLKFRAEESDEKLRLNDDFLEKVQREYRQAKELLEGIKKGPNFLEARLLQMAEYIKMLEGKLGIERSSIFSGLPDVPYGSVPPKAKA